MATPEEMQAEIDQLKQQQSMTVEMARRIIEGRWQGADGAAGLYVALVGGTPPPGFAPVPFP